MSLRRRLFFVIAPSVFRYVCWFRVRLVARHLPVRHLPSLDAVTIEDIPDQMCRFVREREGRPQ